MWRQMRAKSSHVQAIEADEPEDPEVEFRTLPFKWLVG